MKAKNGKPKVFIQVCQSTPVDLVFIIDSSESVSGSDFDHLKLWLRNIISSFPIGPDLVQVGVNYRQANLSFYRY